MDMCIYSSRHRRRCRFQHHKLSKAVHCRSGPGPIPASCINSIAITPSSVHHFFQQYVPTPIMIVDCPATKRTTTPPPLPFLSRVKRSLCRERLTYRSVPDANAIVNEHGLRYDECTSSAFCLPHEMYSTKACVTQCYHRSRMHAAMLCVCIVFPCPPFLSRPRVVVLLLR